VFRRGRTIAYALCALITAATVASSAAYADPSPDAVATAAPDDVAQASPFADIPANSWAYSAIDQLQKDGIVKGYPDGSFKGNRPMTRYEAGVITAAAVAYMESLVEAHKPVAQPDFDAINKLIAAYGTELKTVENHVDKLQQQADATGKLAAATAATVRRQQAHVIFIVRSGAYGQNISASNGPLPVTVNGVTYAPGAALPGGIGTAPTGVSVHGPLTSPGGVVTVGGGAAGGLAWGPQSDSNLPLNSNTTGQYGHGLGTQYAALSFGGNPDDHSQYLFKLTETDRYSSPNFLPSESPAYCPGATVGIAGAACSAANSSAADGDAVIGGIMRLQETWYQYTSPGGLYAKVGKFQQDEGPKQLANTTWVLIDFVNGARVGWRNSRFNVQAGWGMADTAAQTNLLYGVASSEQQTWAQTDYQIDPKGKTDIGFVYSNYSGYHEDVWDAAAVNCVGSTAPTTGLSKTLPLVAGQAYMSGLCGAGYNPIVYGAGGPNAGLPVTGSYLTTGEAPRDETLEGFVVGNYGQLRVVAAGTDRPGIDPTTGGKWQGNLTGYFQADLGPSVSAPGNAGKYTLELGGFAAGMNGLGAGFNYYSGPAIWAQYSTDWSDHYFTWFGVKKWLTDTSSAGLFYANMGLLPNTFIPAGSAQCPGCVISGDSRNALYGEVTLGF
jgi:S-layer homology domain